MPHTDELKRRADEGGDGLVSISGEVRRELLRSDHRGRRYLRFSVVGPAGSTRCYWFLGADARTEHPKHGHRYLVRGQPRPLGDGQVLVVRAFVEVERNVRSITSALPVWCASRCLIGRARYGTGECRARGARSACPWRWRLNRLS